MRFGWSTRALRAGYWDVFVRCFEADILRIRELGY